MREVVVKLQFVSPCLGNVCKYHRSGNKSRNYFVMPRHPLSGKVMFLPKWWAATMQKAAEILCHHQRDVQSVLFAPELEGEPRPIPQQFYRRYIKRQQYVKHEAFFAGDTICVTCVVPDTISNEEFLQLLECAGKYCGISPSQPGKFGFYAVTSGPLAKVALDEKEKASERRNSEALTN